MPKFTHMTIIKYPNQHVLYKAIYQIYFPAIRSFMAQVLKALPSHACEPSIGNEDNIDINDVPHLIRTYWEDAFEQYFARNKDVRSRTGLIGEARNQVAHPGVLDIDYEYASSRLLLIAEVLELINAPEERRAVLTLRDELVRNVGEPSPPLDEQARLPVPLDPTSLPHVAKDGQELVQQQNADGQVGLSADAKLIWDEISEAYETGAFLTGVVKNVTVFGAFVNLNGVDGLIPKTEMAWERIDDPAEIVSVGEEIEVQVIRVAREEKKIWLSLKWKYVEENYPVNSTVRGTIVNFEDYGAFLRLEDGVVGLIHNTKMAWKGIRHPSEVVSLGEEVDAQVLEVSKPDRRISFGLRQLQPRP